jgi:hypothetical protein
MCSINYGQFFNHSRYMAENITGTLCNVFFLCRKNKKIGQWVIKIGTSEIVFANCQVSEVTIWRYRTSYDSEFCMVHSLFLCPTHLSCKLSLLKPHTWRKLPSYRGKSMVICHFYKKFKKNQPLLIVAKSFVNFHKQYSGK